METKKVKQSDGEKQARKAAANQTQANYTGKPAPQPKFGKLPPAPAKVKKSVQLPYAQVTRDPAADTFGNLEQPAANQGGKRTPIKPTTDIPIYPGGE